MSSTTSSGSTTRSGNTLDPIKVLVDSAIALVKSRLLIALVAIVCVVMLFAPAPLVVALRLEALAEDWRSWWDLGLLASAAYLTLLLTARAWGRVASAINARRERRAAAESVAKRDAMRRKLIEQLTVLELQHLAIFIVKKRPVAYFSIGNGVADKLLADGILSRPSQMFDLENGFAHSLEPWANELLQGRSEEMRVLPPLTKRAQRE